MTPRISRRARIRLDDIYTYCRRHFGEDLADRIVSELIAGFHEIPDHGISKPIPAEFGVNGYYYYRSPNFVYWKYLKNGDIGIVTILHERMQQGVQLKEDNK